MYAIVGLGYASAGKKAQDVEDEPDADVVESMMWKLLIQLKKMTNKSYRRSK